MRAIGAYLLLLCVAGCEVRKPAPREIHVSNLPAGSTATVLLIGVRGEKCDGNAFRQTDGSGDLNFKNQVDEHCLACPAPEADRPRIAVFSRGRAAAYLTPDQVCGASSATLNVALAERRKVAMDVWVRSAEFLPLAKDELVNADWVLDKNLTGLAISVRKLGVLPDPEAVPETCNKANKQITATKFFDPNVLNVYYGIGDNSTCKQPVIFTNESGQLLGDLAHEVGHALGLKKSDHEDVYPQGHTNDKGKPVAGFDCNNTMWSKSLMLDHALSLGQSFWMNFSDSSLAASAPRRLTCADKQGYTSPCIPISTGSVPEQGQECKPCTLEQDPSTPRHCTPSEAEKLLSDRHESLTEHAANHGLTMGSISLEEMNKHWRSRTAVGMVAAPVTEAIAAAKSPKDIERYRAYLRKAVQAYGAGLYADYGYVLKLVAERKYGRLRCVSED